MYHLYARRGLRWVEEASTLYASEALRLFNSCEAHAAYIVTTEGAICTSRNLDD